MAYHAHLNFAEAAFVVRDENGKPIVSELVKSPRMGSIHDAHKSFSVSLRSSISDYSPTHPEGVIQRGKLHEGIKMIVHSHPLEKRERVEAVLCPSVGDLDKWEEDRAETRNNYLIEGILVFDGSSIHLLLMQADPSCLQSTDYQIWEDSGSPQKLFHLLEESGFRHTVLRKKIKDNNFSEEELNKLSGLVVDKD